MTGIAGRLSAALLGSLLLVAGGVPPAEAAGRVAGPGGEPQVRAVTAPDRVLWPNPVRSGRANASWAPAEGSYVNYLGRIFRIAGGAPLYVSSWDNVPRGRATEIQPDQWDKLRWYPKDGTFVTATGGRVYRFVAGVPLHVTTWAVYGRAQPSIAVDAAAIAHAGLEFPYDAVLAVAFDVGPRWNPGAGLWDFNGSVFVSTQQNRVYKLVGGTPVYVSTWAAFGGPKATIRVDQATVDRAGQAAPFNFLRKHLADEILVKAAQSGQLFQAIGGAPLYVTDLGRLNPASMHFTAAVVDQNAVDRAGGALPFDNLRLTPRDGVWFLTDGPSVPVYQTRGGRAIAATPEAGQELLSVNQLTVDNAGGPPPWNHLLAP